MVFRLRDRRDYMSREQAAAIAQSLRDSPFDPGGDVVEQRVLFARLMATRPPACRGNLAAARRRLGASAVPRRQAGAKPAGQDAGKTRPWEPR